MLLLTWNGKTEPKINLVSPYNYEEMAKNIFYGNLGYFLFYCIRPQQSK